MHAHVDKLVVIQPGAPQGARTDIETQRLDQMQLATGIGRQADHIAGIGRDFGLK